MEVERQALGTEPERGPVGGAVVRLMQEKSVTGKRDGQGGDVLCFVGREHLCIERIYSRGKQWVDRGNGTKLKSLVLTVGPHLL